MLGYYQYASYHAQETTQNTNTFRKINIVSYMPAGTKLNGPKGTSGGAATSLQR